MTRKLILLNLALAGLLAALVWHMRREWIDAHVRAENFFAIRVAPLAAKPLAPLPRVSPLVAANYATIAQLNLFSKDRNPQVVIDVVPVQEKPIPAFPVARGVLLWEGTPPAILLSTRPGSAQRSYHAGEQIGEWKIVSLDNQYVTFEWDGKEFKKRIDELMDRTPLVAEAAPRSAPSQAAAPSQPKVQSLSDSSKSDHFVDVGSTDTKGCKPGDDTPAGTVVDGFKKVVSSTPFGSACRWVQEK